MILTLASLVLFPAAAGTQKPAPAAAGKAASASTAPLATVRSVTRSPLPRGERITVEISQEITYASERLPSPDRVYFDFRGATVGLSVANAAQSLGGAPLISAVRMAQHSEQVARLVFALGGPARYSAFVRYSPFRVVIDIERNDPEAPAPAVPAGLTPAPAAAPAPPPEPPAPTPDPPPAAPQPVPEPSPAPPSLPVAVDTAAPAMKTRPSALSAPPPASTLSRGEYSLSRQLGLGVARIVIDAGHGGHDPGAQGNGVTESELVLDVALRLERLLKDVPGVETVLTRRTNDFIPLEERTAIANREGADLFLSIHANASRQPAATGLETYFLNFATNPAAEAVAARENATSGRTMGNLPELVKTITLNNKVVESRELATIVQSSMVKRLRLQNKTLRDLGVKQAPFVVLIGAQMPSVLAEISFVTNRSDATLLKQNAYRQRIAQSLADAVVKYQGSLKKAQPVAVKAQDR